MKYAPIAPPHLGEVLLEAPTTYHFALGQELVRSRLYLNIYQTLRSQGAFIIVDNGAAEKDQVPFDTIVRATIPFGGADEYILPDVLRDKNATVEATCNDDVRMQVPPLKRMIVPQGRDWLEWSDCLFTIDERLQGYYATIGVAKHLESLQGGRRQALELITRNDFHRRHQIHLLGAYRSMIKEATDCSQSYPGVVRGIDSGEPVAHAQQGLISDANSPHYSLNWTGSTDITVALVNVRRACDVLHLLG